MRWLAFLLVVGCAGNQVRSEAGAVRGVIHRARDNGAYRCAPRELAMAESHAEFAETELSEGDYYRARQELAVADENANEALRKSPRDRCLVATAVERKDTDHDGLYDDEDRCPEDPEDKDAFQDDDGCPERDNDADGIADLEDRCPLAPEDVDSFQDKDGCPDEDNDTDGLVDRVDQCPLEPEDKDNFEDDDGCPDLDNDKDKVADKDDKCPNEFAQTPDGCPKKYQLIVVQKDRIELKQTIFFDFRKTRIKPVSYPLLDEVARALRENASIRVRIEGHTDSRGSDRLNLKLSQGRAESVRKYLARKGIAPGRMEPRGFGETVPIADNRTEEGRSQNRRVEFIIIR